MRSWGMSIGMMGPKFWKLYRKEGLMRTVLRGKIYKPTHEKAGFTDEVVNMVGSDEFGNRYYEDFTHLGKNQRRWVEYADSGRLFPTMVTKVAPGWHGWLHYMYDDPPREDNFVNPYYRNHRTPQFKTDTGDGLTNYRNPGHLLNPQREENMANAKARMYSAWEPPTGSEERNGKKIMKAPPVNDGRAFKDQD